MSAIETVLKRDRWVALAGLLLIAGLAWLFILDGGGTGMSTLRMTTWEFPPRIMPNAADGWPAGYWLAMLGMWWIMMVAMMVPSAAPMILLYVRVMRHEQAKGSLPDVAAPAAWFLAGYLLVWLGFSMAAVTLQWGLEQAGLMHRMMMWSLDRWLSAGLLFAAALYQVTPLKEACLRFCRSPAEFLSRHWRPGRGGAMRLGLRHGAFCVGCCWILMLLLFVGGIMNLVWVAGLAIFVLAEKLLPWGRAVTWGGSALLAVGAVYILTAP
jgi:predicted metal-binding membrane protein